MRVEQRTGDQYWPETAAGVSTFLMCGLANAVCLAIDVLSGQT